MADRALSQGPTMQVADTSPVLYDGTQAAGVAAAALNSGTALAVTEILLQNDSASPAAVKVGNATSQSLTLPVGASVVIPIDNVADIFVKRVGGADCTVNWWARG